MLLQLWISNGLKPSWTIVTIKINIYENQRDKVIHKFVIITITKSMLIKHHKFLIR